MRGRYRDEQRDTWSRADVERLEAAIDERPIEKGIDRLTDEMQAAAGILNLPRVVRVDDDWRHRPPPGVAIECRSGSVWITLDHDRRDIVLAAGERFDGDVHRRALVSALDSACIAVSSDRPIVLPLPPAAEPAPRAAWS
jgi:hypothetical protein